MLPIGYQICLRRLERKLTQEELAHRVGIPQPNLSNIEKGKQDITVSTLRRIAGALATRPGEFFSGVTEKQKNFSSRRSLERIARIIAGGQKASTAKEQEIVERFKQLIPGKQKVQLRGLHRAWLELRVQFSSEEINTVHERVEEYRRRA